MSKRVGLFMAITVGVLGWMAPASAGHGSPGSGWGKCAYDPQHNCEMKAVDKAPAANVEDVTSTTPARKTIKHR